MNNTANPGDTDRIDRAFNRVLTAEAQAREEVEQCRRAAAALIDGAAGRARSIADRADQRVQLVHAIADASVARAVNDLLAGARGIGADADPAPVPGLDQAIETLVDEILGLPAGAGR